MIKLIVFDWNGTLIADTLACMAADNRILKAYGGTPVNLKTYRDTIIIPAINFYTLHGCSREEFLQNPQKRVEIYQSFYETRVSKIRTRKSTKKLLHWLYKNKVESVILSNHTIEGIRSQLVRLGLDKYFTHILANETVKSTLKGRNKKEKLDDFFQQSKLKPQEVIIIGDSPEEVEMGKHVGIITVSITNGYYARKRLIAAQPDYLINNLEEIIDIIKKK